MPTVRSRNIALDGHPDSANPSDQHWALAEFGTLGGDKSALFGALVGDHDGAQLRREQQAFTDHHLAVQQERSLNDQRLKLKNIRAVLLQEFKIDCPEVLLVRERRIGGEQERLRSLAARNDPQTLADRRRGTAKGTNRAHLHHQIPPTNERTHLRGTRKFYIPHVVRIVHAHVSEVTHAIQRRERKRLVSNEINKLTADLVRAFYPVWAAGLKPGAVREIIRNAQRSQRPAR
jgi:hypothetical protein